MRVAKNSIMEPKKNFEELDFQKYWLVLQRRWIPATGIFGLSVILASLATLLLKPAYKAETTLLIKANHTSSLTGLGESIGKLDTLGGITSNPLDTQVKIVASVPFMEETISSLHLKDGHGKKLKIRDFSKKLKVEGSKGTDILQITYTDSDPQLAATIVNKLSDIYIRNNIQSNRAEAVSARKFIVEQLPGTETSVRAAESELRKFKEQNKIIVLPEESSAAVKTISKIEGDIAEAQAQLVDITGRSQKLLAQVKVDSQQAIDFTSLSQAPGVQTVLTQLQEAESLLTVNQTIYQPEHPTIINLTQKVTALKRLLNERIQQVAGNNQKVTTGNLQIGKLRQELIGDIIRAEADRTGLIKRIATLTTTQSAYKQRANILPRLEQTQRELERRQKAAQTTYEILLTRLQEIQVAENQNVGNVRVVSLALVPENSSSPGKKVILLGGGVVGILLGLIAAFTIDLMDRSLKTVRETREIFPYTLLGVIPALKRNNKTNSYGAGLDQSIPQVIGRDLPHFPLGDAYQMLQANLKFLSSDHEVKAITVTSSVAKEGKSEVAANLALAMSLVGHRVLLVDADLRHPIQHHIWNLTNAMGLSNVIFDQVSLEVAVQKAMPNLYVLPSGVMPPNPAALLDSQRMASLTATFTKNYDFVIFDTPALAGTADAAVLGKLTDGILLVVRPEVVDSSRAYAAKEFLTQTGQKVLGIAINAVNVKHEPDSYFYYTKEPVELGLGSALKEKTSSVSSKKHALNNLRNDSSSGRTQK